MCRLGRQTDLFPMGVGLGLFGIGALAWSAIPAQSCVTASSMRLRHPKEGWGALPPGHNCGSPTASCRGRPSGHTGSRPLRASFGGRRTVSEEERSPKPSGVSSRLARCIAIAGSGSVTGREHRYRLVSGAPSRRARRSRQRLLRHRSAERAAIEARRYRSCGLTTCGVLWTSDVSGDVHPNPCPLSHS